MVEITRLPLVAAMLLLACSSAGPDRRLRVGEEPGDQGGGAGSAGNAGSAGSGGIAVGDQALHVHVEDVAEMAIDVITLACAGDCADVEAVARGGNPPYTFEWDDGSTSAARTVCLDASTTLSVSATDTAIETAEFAYDAQTATTDVRAEVLSCSDGGSADGGAASELCIGNPSFEGVPASSPPDAPPWSNCPGAFEGISEWTRLWSESSALLNQTLPSPPASDGTTYLLIGPNGGVGNQDVTQLLCAPLRAGDTYHLRLDVAVPTFFGADSPIGTAGGSFELWAGATAACSRDELLWTSPPIMGAGWTTLCVELKPTHDAAALTLVPSNGGGADVNAVLVDHLVATDSCP